MEKDRKYIITAIQVAKGKIKISYDASGDMGTESYTLISAEKARPELYKAMFDLRSHVASLLEIDFQGMDDRIRPRVVKFDYDSNDRMSAIIEADFKVPLAMATVPIRTPEKTEPIDSEVDINEAVFMFASTADQLKLLMKEVLLFIDGKRAQEILLFSDDKK